MFLLLLQMSVINFIDFLGTDVNNYFNTVSTFRPLVQTKWHVTGSYALIGAYFGWGGENIYHILD